MVEIFVVFYKFLSGLLVLLPTRKSLSLNWNYGSLLFFIYVFQVFSGVFLAFNYSNEVFYSFSRVQFIIYERFLGWIFRLFHFNGARFFFFILFLHFFKGLFFFSYRLFKVWNLGLLIFVILIATAFIGYVLVWSQISFWAAVVITSLFTVIPFFGFKLVFWIWGGFSVTGATLKFFFVIHFLLPWLLVLFIFLHLFFLHDTGSTSKLYYCGSVFKLNFYSFYWLKDLFNLLVFFFFFIFLFLKPFSLGDPELFLEADFINSPVHIVPEWYFLFAYAILRSIPNKFLGILFLFVRIFSFFFFNFFFNYNFCFNSFNFFFVRVFIFFRVFLSWLGQCLVEYPFSLLGLIFTFFYFILLLLIFLNYVLRFFVFIVFIIFLILKI